MSLILLVDDEAGIRKMLSAALTSDGHRVKNFADPRDAVAALPHAERLAPLGCMWTSTLLPERAPKGSVLLDCYLGGARHPESAGWSDTLSADRCLAAMAPLLGITGDPEMVRVDRHARLVGH